ncbi:hypothetical protein Nepgr_003867 [Nepenthes gracilis]|uniref:Uncharacterized protein n=1 Tax=Nepenthes gracilis TaxID=150966 RepID=A0AAD3S0F1_NEPGR|nr:hypothetical protein Nepgr_003867 [Nepenthes gracilis]
MMWWVKILLASDGGNWVELLDGTVVSLLDESPWFGCALVCCGVSGIVNGDDWSSEGLKSTYSRSSLLLVAAALKLPPTVSLSWRHVPMESICLSCIFEWADGVDILGAIGWVHFGCCFFTYGEEDGVNVNCCAAARYLQRLFIDLAHVGLYHVISAKSVCWQVKSLLMFSLEGWNLMT